MRNITSNVGNQLMRFLTNRYYSERIIDRLIPGCSPEWKNCYFREIARLKSRFGNYYNDQKLLELWFKRRDQHLPDTFLQVRRIVSQQFLSSEMPRMVLTSKRISKKLRIEHIKKCRQVLRLLRKHKDSDKL